LCRRHPSLRSLVLDRKEALPTARQIAAARHHDDVVSFREGDLLHDDFGDRTFDVALLCNILHHFPAETNKLILQRVRRALKPGGTVGIFDIETPADDARPDAAGDAFALYFRITSSSSCYRAADYVDGLREAGFSKSDVVRSIKMPSRMLVVGVA
jgi:ubiquinone/menaquinone biosynthesis C-methylase UbiE